MDPVIEVYTNGIASQTLQAEVYGEDYKEASQKDLLLMLPKERTLAEKIKLSNDYTSDLPQLVPEGDGSTAFSFQKNYILLAYYCLIQFRNYQASNFNILFLILASYIVKNHVNVNFIEALQRFTVIILENFTKLDKTDEMDLFFGKCGRNEIREPPHSVEFIQKWFYYVVPHQSGFHHKIVF